MLRLWERYREFTGTRRIYGLFARKFMKSLRGFVQKFTAFVRNLTEIHGVRSDVSNLWESNRLLMTSHGEMRTNLQAINDTLTKTMKAQEECVALQSARLEFVKAGKRGKILRSRYAWSNINFMMKPKLMIPPSLPRHLPIGRTVAPPFSPPPLSAPCCYAS